MPVRSYSIKFEGKLKSISLRTQREMEFEDLLILILHQKSIPFDVKSKGIFVDNNILLNPTLARNMFLCTEKTIFPFAFTLNGI